MSMVASRICDWDQDDVVTFGYPDVVRVDWKIECSFVSMAFAEYRS